MRVPDIDLLTTVDLLYAAALEPDRWPEALDAISRSVGAIGTSMVPVGPEGTVRSMASDSLLEANAQYQAEWWQRDTPTRRLVTRGIRPGAVGTDRLVMEEEEIRRDPFYQDFLRPHGIAQSMATVVALGPGQLLSVATQRGLGRGLYSPQDVAVLAALAPHIARALTLATALADARRLADDFSGALERIAMGVVTLDGRGKVRTMNPLARQMMGDGLTVVHGTVHATLRADDARLQAAIKAALPGDDLLPARGFLVHRAEGRPPYHVEVAPLRPRLDTLEQVAFGDGGAMLLIRRLDPTRKSVAHYLAAMGLTPAEIRLAEALGQGARLRTAAELLGIAYETARTHLRSIFNKLDVRRQSELVALVTRLSGMVSP
ncbi:helix-turn-helix transcriptional regulator [Aquabacter spiritensis]|uniref:DNA-binding CsgD family transcriptional regulator n=1 Tax=Aquabacter spiritensis TaxID=933073 RepID=A0A4R3LTH6_9HYPH|nr:helix-turn-helix transcriptional regulator [Aquabacter spiritensis]TCT03874.1 DNA-binding CsgD family transcriptional regulator [Aquabacter spiritensis]